MQEDLRKRVVQALRAGEITPEEVERAWQRISEEFTGREEFSGGLWIFELCITMLNDADGIDGSGLDTLEEYVLAPEEERDLSGAVPGTPEHNRRAARVIAARFADVLAEEHGILAKGGAPPEQRPERGASQERREEDTEAVSSPAVQEDTDTVSGGVTVSWSTGRAEISPAAQEDTGSAVSRSAGSEDTAAPPAAVPREKLHGMSRAQLIDLIMQLENELLVQSLEKAQLRRTLAEHGLAPPESAALPPGAVSNPEAIIAACRERIRTLEEMIRMYRHMNWTRAPEKEKTKVERAVDAVLCLQKCGGEADINRLAAATGLSRSQAWRYARWLAECGLLTRRKPAAGPERFVLTETLMRVSDREMLGVLIYDTLIRKDALKRPLAEPRNTSISGEDTQR